MELYGWDIVYGATVDIINQQLAIQAQSLLTTFNYDRTDAADGLTFNLSGNFGNWTITGGQDSLIEITMPIAQGRISFAGANNDTSHDLSGVAVKVNLPLSFKVSAQNPDIQVLVFDFVAKGDGEITAEDIVITGLNDPAQKLKDTTITGIFKQAFRELLTANRSKISYEFASVMLTGANNNWAAPKYASFYYSKPENSNTAYFHILAMAYKDNANGISPKLDPILFSDSGANRYLAFSKDILLHSMIQPGLPDAIDAAIYPNDKNIAHPFVHGVQTSSHGSTPPDVFQYNFDSHTIEGGNISLNPKYDPSAHVTVLDDSSMDMSVQVADNTFHTIIDAVSVTEDAVQVTVHAEYNNVVSFDTNKKQFVTASDPNPIITHSLDVDLDPTSLWGAIFGLGLAGLVLLPVIAVKGLDNFTEKIEVNSFVNLPISWNGLGKDFEVHKAALSGNIYLIGKS
jgi:hypothetical protein